MSAESDTSVKDHRINQSGSQGNRIYASPPDVNKCSWELSIKRKEQDGEETTGRGSFGKESTEKEKRVSLPRYPSRCL